MERHLDDARVDGVTVHDPAACRAFIWWHDAIYEPEAPPGRNEARSAELCRTEMAAVGDDPARIDRTVAMIEATARHVAPLPDIAPDAPLMLDIDLSILGASRDAYRAFAEAIRREYAHVADADYRAGRARILQGFLDRAPIYLTAWARERWEEAARANLAWEIATLAGD